MFNWGGLVCDQTKPNYYYWRNSVQNKRRKDSEKSKQKQQQQQQMTPEKLATLGLNS